MAGQGHLARAAVALAVAGLAWPLAGQAEVVTDGTLGAVARLTGPDVTVPARLGQRRGANLFHSFARFGVEAGGRVTFKGPEGLENVIGRVTGGEASRIDGTLASSVPGADLWLLNPAGIMFGAGARLDVQGSFHASTAGELRFEDGAVFSALDPSGSALSVAPPQAFGFLGAPTGITVDGSLLEVPAGEALSLTGGPIDVAGGKLRAAAGTVALAAMAGPGEVPALGETATGAATGNITLSGGARVAARGDGGGTIHIRGGQIVIAKSNVFADNTGAAPPRGGIDIEAGKIALTGPGRISAGTFGDGDAGRITVTASDSLSITGDDVLSSTGIFSRVEGTGATGHGGTVTIDRTGTIMLASGGEIAASTLGVGDAGEVTIRAGYLKAQGSSTKQPSRISARAERGSTGRAGTVEIEAGNIELLDVAGIGASTLGKGSAGEVRIVVPGRLLMRGNGEETSTFIDSQAQVEKEGNQFRPRRGDSGNIHITADILEIRHGARISSGTFRKGLTGTVTVTANHLLIAGDNAVGFTGINSRVNKPAVGRGGGVTVTVTDDIVLESGGEISADILGGGAAGAVTVTAGRVTASSSDRKQISRISSRSTESSGDAGDVMVSARDVIELRGHAVISSSAADRSTGNAGIVTVIVGSRLRMLGNGEETSTVIASDVRRNRSSSGNAGTVRVEAIGGEIEIRNGARIGSSVSAGSGNAGEVIVKAGRLLISHDDAAGPTGIISEAREAATGRAGDVRLAIDALTVDGGDIVTQGVRGGGGLITINATGLIHLIDAKVTSNATQAEAGRSVIEIRAPVIVLNDSRATSLTGQRLKGSGLARLIGDTTVISADSLVDASSAVTITGAESDIGSRLEAPQGVFLDAGSLLRESCAARRSDRASSFTAMGRGGLPPDPARPLPGAYADLGPAAAAGQAGPALAAASAEGCRAAPGG